MPAVVRKVFMGLLTALFFIEPVFALEPNDPYGRDQWFYTKVGLPEVWEHVTGSEDVVVAVIDGPMDTDHPDLVDNLWHNPDEILDGKDNDGNGYIDDTIGWDFLYEDRAPSVNTKSAKDTLATHHATTVAGIIGARGNNAVGGAGVNWQVKIMPLQTLDEEGSGLVSDVMEAIEYAIEKKVDVINLSFVGEGFDEPFYRLLKRAYEAGIVVVAASGNDNKLKGEGNLNIHRKYPVCYDSEETIPFILGVAAVTSHDEVTEFSNYGSGCIDLSAPGQAVSSLGVHAPDDGFPVQFIDGLSGTSIAAPFVSGAAALLKAAYPKLSAADIIGVLKESARSLDEKNALPFGSLGAGRLDVAAAYALAGTLEGSRRGAEFVVMFDGGQYTVVRHFSHDFVKQTQFVTPVPFEQIITLEIIDVNRDGVQEVVYAYADSRGTHIVAYSLEGYKIFEKNISARALVTVGLSAADVRRDGNGGLVAAFPEASKLRVVEYEPDGRVFHWFDGAKLADDLESVAVRFSDLGFIYGMAHYGSYTDRYRWNFIGAFDRRTRFDVPDGSDRPVAMNGNGSVIAFGAAAGRASSVAILRDEQTGTKSFTPFTNFKGGTSIAIIDWDMDGRDELVVGAGPGGGPAVRIFALDGTLEAEFAAHGVQYNRGIFARAFNR